MGKEKSIFVFAMLFALLAANARAEGIGDWPIIWQAGTLTEDSPLIANACKIYETPEDVTARWLPPTMIAFALIVGLIALVYVLSGLQGGVSQSGVMAPAGGFFFATQLTTTKLRTWAKDALWGVVTTAIIITMFTASYGGLEKFGMNYISKSLWYGNTVRNTLIADFGVLTWFSMTVSFMSQTPSLAIWGYGLRFSLVPVLKPVFDMLGIILNLSIASLGEWFAQIYFLCFIRGNMLGIFFPMALFMRAFKPTKAIGNTMLALAIGFFFVYPFLVSLNADIVNDKYGVPKFAVGTGGECDLSKIDLRTEGILPKWHLCIYDTALRDSVWRSVKALFIFSPGSAPLHAWLEQDAWGKIMGPAFFFLLAKTVSWPGALSIAAVVTFIPILLESVAYFIFIVSVIMPVFNIFVTITITMELSKALGTEIDLSAIEKLL